MGQTKRVIKNIIGVTLSNLSTILAGVVVGFIIPKVMTVDGYGYYKTFTLYIAYAGFFSLGIMDGIVLDYGGYNYDELNQQQFRSIFKWYLLVHVIADMLFLIAAILNRGNESSFLLLMIALYITSFNIVGYYQQISQITQRFKEYSIARMTQSILKVAGGLLMLAIYYVTRKAIDYRLYVTLLTAIHATVAIGYVCIYKNITLGKALKLSKSRGLVFHLAKIGFPLLFSNLCGTLILTLDRQFVNILFTNAEYAVYAFAYNLLSLITVATSAMSTVIYPMMKRNKEDTLKDNYDFLLSFVLILSFLAMISYFPLCKFIEFFLPKYNTSLTIFRVIFPGLAVSASISVVMQNYYKTFGENLLFFKRSVKILVLSAIANAIAYLTFRTTISISVASIITLIVWYLYTEQYFVELYEYDRRKNFFYMIVMMMTFYLATVISNLIVSGAVYVVMFLTITILLYKSTLMKMKDNFLKK